MYRAVSTLRSSRIMQGGSEIVEIALCLAAGEHSPVIVVSRAPGARAVRDDCKTIRASTRKLCAATAAAIHALLQNSQTSAAIVCAGKLDPSPKAQQDLRAACAFAARHKLPLLFLIANSLTPGQSQELDLRHLYPELGIPVFSVDSADAIAAYRVATEALHNVAHQRGPSVIEALTIHAPNVPARRPLQILADYMERHGVPLP
jgi:hypothetical protein